MIKKKIHICFLTRNYDAPEFGGRNPSLRYISEELKKRGYIVTIISTPSCRNHLQKKFPNYVYFTKFFINYYFTVLLSPILIYLLMRKINRKCKIDIIHSCEREFMGVIGYIFKKVHKIFLVQWVYDMGYSAQKREVLLIKKSPLKYLAIFYFKLAEKFVLSNADVVATIGKDIQKDLIKRGFDKNRIFFIGNCIDTEKFKPQKPSKKLLKEFDLRNKIVISFIGRITFFRGANIFIKSIPLICKKIKNSVFLIAGSDKDNYKKQFVLLSKKLGIADKIIWAGVRHDVPDILNISDFVVIPPRKGAGGIGNALLEAMSCGKAVIQSDVASAPYVIKNYKNGVLFKDGDYKAIASSIIYLYNNKKLKKEIEKNARETVLRNYTVEKIVDKLEKIYRKLLEKE